MSPVDINPRRAWTVADAKARLSEILRLCEEEGPQRIGSRKSFVVVPEHVWRAHAAPREPLGRWLVDNVPRGANLDFAGDRESRRKIPFTDEVTE